MSKEDVVEKKKFRNALLIAAIPVAMGFISLTVSLHSNTLTKKVEILRKEIEIKNAKLEQINIAMVNIRAYLLANKTFCKQSKFTGNLVKLRYDYIHVLAQLITADYSVVQVFGVELRENILKFTAMIGDENNISDLCSKSIYNDDKLRAMQKTINLAFTEYIKKDKDALQDLEGSFLF